MRLAAIYIKDHFLFENGKPQTINFGGKNIYSFNTLENNEIEITKIKNPDFIDGFWGENISLVSAIVGANGAGKTSMLYEIFFNNKSDKNSVYIMEIDNDIIFNESLTSLLKPWCQIFKINCEKDIIRLPIVENHNGYSIDFYMNFKDNNGPLIYSCLGFENQTDSKIETHFLQIKKIFRFLTQKNLITILNQKLNGEVNFFKQFSFKPQNIYYLDIFIDKEIEFCSQKFKKVISRDEFFNFIENKQYKSFLYDLYKTNDFENQDPFSKIKILLLAKIFTLKYTEINNNYKSSFIELVYNLGIIRKIKETKFYTETIKEILFYEDKIDNREFSTNGFNSIKLLINKIENNLTYDIKKETEDDVFELLENYFDVERFFKIKQNSISLEFLDNFLVFEPTHSISQGEYFLIQLFSNLFTMKDDKTKYILLDEADLGFHPIWKKKFINIITTILPDIFQSSKTNPIQIIFTTHDALTLSDIPNSNIVYLKKEGDKTMVLEGKERPQKSFGANIHDLLADSFFIGDGLIGDFAKEKINKTIKWLNLILDKKDTIEKLNNNNNNSVNGIENLEKEIKEHLKDEIDLNHIDYKKYYRLIQMIDEPFMKIKLEEMYNCITSNLYKKEQLEAQKEKIEAELNKLKS